MSKKELYVYVALLIIIAGVFLPWCYSRGYRQGPSTSGGGHKVIMFKTAVVTGIDTTSGLILSGLAFVAGVVHSLQFDARRLLLFLALVSVVVVVPRLIHIISLDGVYVDYGLLLSGLGCMLFALFAARNLT